MEHGTVKGTVVTTNNSSRLSSIFQYTPAALTLIDADGISHNLNVNPTLSTQTIQI